MSSSQGGNTGIGMGNVDPSIPPGYPFSVNSIRDASDWIKYKKEARKYSNYKFTSSDNKNTEPYWLKYGNQFRLSYSFGRWKCDGFCSGNAFNSNVGDESLFG